MPGSPDKPKHLELLRKALAVRERLVRLRPDDWEAHLGLAASLNNIGEVMEGKDRGAEQLALWRRALAEMETAYRLQPGDPTTVLVLVSQLRKLADLAGRMGAVDEALAAHRREVEVLDHRVRDNPGVAGFDAELVGGYARLLEGLRSAGRLDEAAKVADRARERIAETTEETTEYFGSVSHLSLVVHSLALDRARASGGAVKAEREAAAAVNDLRRHVLAGWHQGAEWMRTDPRTEPLRQRADFKDLLARMDELDPADAAVKNPNATPEERLAARRTILAALEALARPLPPARYIRRNLAQARQDVAQALLDAGRIDEARAELDEAMAERQSLLAEAPTDDTLRTDLAESRFLNRGLARRRGTPQGGWRGLGKRA